MVTGHEADPAAADPAAFIDDFEIRRFGLANLVERFERSAVQHDTADPELDIRYAAIAHRLGDRAHGQEYDEDRPHGSQQ